MNSVIFGRKLHFSENSIFDKNATAAHENTPFPALDLLGPAGETPRKKCPARETAVSRAGPARTSGVFL